MKKTVKIVIFVLCIALVAAGAVYYMSLRSGEFRLNESKQTVEYFYLGKVRAKDATVTINDKEYVVSDYAVKKIGGKDRGYIKTKDGKKYYLVKGKTYNGLLNKKLYKNGLFNSSANGKIKVDNTEYLFKDGVLFSGLYQKSYYVDGLVDKTKDGFIKVDDIEYLFEKGKLYTGLKNKLYYIDGQPDKKKSGFYNIDGKKLYFENGKLFTGILEKKYYKDGVFNKKNGNVKYKNKTYFLENGTLYTGFKNKTVYVEGLIDKTINGYQILEGVEYYFKEGVVSEVPNDVPVKILLVGNSYTYYQGMGQMLSAFIYSTGKHALVVRATIGGLSLSSIMANPKVAYVAFYNGKKLTNGKNPLDTIVQTDFGELNRKGRWDYILCQNNDKDSKLRSTTIDFYNKYINCVPETKDMLIHVTYFSGSTAPNRRSILNSVAAECKCNPVNSSLYYARYNSYFGRNWIKDLTVQDNPKHPSSKGAYLMALCIYSKIYGTERLAKSTDDKNFIKVYNSDKGYTNEFADNKFKRKKKTTNYSMTVTKSDAKKMQTFVSKFADEYLGVPVIKQTEDNENKNT